MYVAIRFIREFYFSSHQWCFQGQNVAHLTATSTPVWRYRYRYSRSKDITYKGCNVAICTDLGTRARHKTKFLIRPIAFKRELGKYGVQGYNGCNPARVSRNGGRQYQVCLVASIKAICYPPTNPFICCLIILNHINLTFFGVFLHAGDNVWVWWGVVCD